MEKTTKNNSGFTLIELVIAMAILAFLMTAVSSFMGTGVLSFRKTKADVDVHGSAQDVYDQISNSIMSANDLIICAYIIDGTIEGTTATNTDAAFLDPGEVSDVTLKGPYYFVRDEKQKEELESATSSLAAYYIPNEGFKYFKDIPEGVSLYVKQIIVDKAVAIDKSCSTELTAAASLPTNINNALTGKQQTIELAEKNKDNTKEAGTPGPSVQYAKTADGGDIYNVNDTERSVYTFENETMYLQRQYAFMDKLNDYYSGDNPTSIKKDCKYTSALNYLKVSGLEGADTVSGCILKTDKNHKGFYLKMYFSDKNTTYASDSMINIRNSYVLKVKK